ncbi:MAG TPA: hypothetical protein VGF93_05050 [Solirubrobacteraceae bacterium]
MTTPGKLALVAALVVAGTACFGVIATLAERSRAAAVHTARFDTEPLLVQAVTLYTSLSDANATAATTFLTGGLEPASRRAHYLLELRLASAALTTLARDAGESDVARVAVSKIAGELPVYAGLIESARANNLQGFPVGASYLRRASGLLNRSMLPAAERLYATEANRLDADYRSGTSAGPLVVIGIAIVVAIGILIGSQLYVARISRRILNVWMVVATLVIAAVSIWAVVGLVVERNALLSAQRQGSDSLEVLSAARVLLSRAQSDESLILASRGSDETDPADLAGVMRMLSPHGGLIAEIDSLASRTGETRGTARMAQEFDAYRSQTQRISDLQNRGTVVSAVDLAATVSARQSAPASRLSIDLRTQIAAAQSHFTREASDATSALTGLAFAIPVLALVAAVFALVGIRERRNEYR